MLTTVICLIMPSRVTHAASSASSDVRLRVAETIVRLSAQHSGQLLKITVIRDSSCRRHDYLMHSFFLMTRLLPGYAARIRAALCTSALVFTLQLAHAQQVTITFEGLQNFEDVRNYYAGGHGSLGSGPGPDYGITF